MANTIIEDSTELKWDRIKGRDDVKINKINMPVQWNYIRRERSEQGLQIKKYYYTSDQWSLLKLCEYFSTCLMR